MSDQIKPYAHLRKSLQHLTLLPDEQRVMICLQDVFIDYPTSQSIIETIGYMLKVENKIQAPCMLVWGSGGYGKTSIIQRIKAVNAEKKEKLLLRLLIKMSAFGCRQFGFYGWFCLRYISVVSQ